MSRITSSSSTGSVTVSSGTVNIQDTAGNALTSTMGALNVNVVSAVAGGSSDLVLRYDEATNVVVGVETLIVQYTASAVPDTTSYLILIASTGTNISEHRVYLNGSVIDKQYAYYTQFSLEFDYRSDAQAAPGLKLNSGDIVQVKAINNGTVDCSLNAKIQALEVLSA